MSEPINKVFDFVEFVARVWKDKKAYSAFEEKTNSVWGMEGVPYSILRGVVSSRFNQSESETIKQSIEKDDYYENCTQHLKKALAAMRGHAVENWQEAIRESASALEALVRIMLNAPNKDLVSLLQKFQNEKKIHRASAAMVKGIYDFASDASGCRHSHKAGGHVPTEADARFIVVASCAAVNFLVAHDAPSTDSAAMDD